MKSLFRKYAGAVFLLMLVLAVTGCSWQLDITIPPSSGHEVYGDVTLGGVGVPGAQVFFRDSGRGPLVTNAYGRFEGRLPKGSYPVEIPLLHGTYKLGSVDVRDTKYMGFSLHPGIFSWYNDSLFRQLAGLYTQSQRWAGGQVRVYMKADSGTGLPSNWRDMYWQAFREWEAKLVLDRRAKVQFVQAANESSAHIVVHIVHPNNSVLDGGIGRFRWESNNGHMEKAWIYISSAYAPYKGMIRRYVTRAMGGQSLNDPNSLMYDRYNPDTHPHVSELSSGEWRHLQLLYDLPPGVRALGTGRQLSARADGSSGDEAEGIQLDEALMGVVQGDEVLLPDGDIVHLSSDGAASPLNTWW